MSSELHDHIRGKVYESLVLGILLCGCEAWALSTSNLQRASTPLHSNNARYLRGFRRPCYTSRTSDRPSLYPVFAKLGVQRVDTTFRLPPHPMGGGSMLAWPTPGCPAACILPGWTTMHKIEFTDIYRVGSTHRLWRSGANVDGGVVHTVREITYAGTA